MKKIFLEKKIPIRNGFLLGVEKRERCHVFLVLEERDLLCLSGLGDVNARETAPQELPGDPPGAFVDKKRKKLSEPRLGEPGVHIFSVRAQSLDGMH